MNGVLMITSVTHSHVGGMEIYHHQLAARLAGLGKKVTMLPVDDDRPASSAGNGYEIVSLAGLNQPPLSLLRSHLLYRTARWVGSRLIKTQGLDFILCGPVHWLPLAQELSRLHGVPYAVICHGVEVWGDLAPAKAEALKHCDAAMAVSAFTAGKIVEKGVSPTKIVRLTPHVDAVRYRVDPISGNAIRRQRGWMGKNVLLTVGRLSAAERYKGHDAILHAVSRLAAGHSDLVYAIAGSGDDRPRLEALALQLGIQTHVAFLGYVPDSDLPALYNACDVFVMPSRVEREGRRWVGEGFGIVFLEASASGKPVIGPNQGGALDAIEDGATGLLVDPTDVAAIAEAIQKLIEDDAYAVQLGRNGRARIEKEFGLDALERHVREWLEIVGASTVNSPS